MAHYVCRPVTDLPAYMQAQVRVPAALTDGLRAGEVVQAEKLDENLYGNYSVYTPEQITDITKQDWAIVLNGTFEEMKDGRRPDGNPDYTTYIYKPGEVATAIRMIPNVKFELSVDACDNTVSGATIKPGDNLVPANDAYTLAYSAATTTVTAKHYLTIEATKFFRLGGQFGGDFASTLVVRAKSL